MAKKELDIKTVAISSALVIVLAVLGTITLFGYGPVVTGFASNPTGTTSATVATATDISVANSPVAFGSIAVGGNNNTEDGDPTAFVITNDGNVNVNVTVYATVLWTVSGSANTTNYTVNSTESEAGTLEDSAVGMFPYMIMPIASANSTFIIKDMAFQSAADAMTVNINITVPAEEVAAAKSSTITFTASAA